PLLDGGDRRGEPASRAKGIMPIFFDNTVRLLMQKECDRHDGVGDQQLQAFEPIAFAVLDDKIYDDNCEHRCDQPRLAASGSTDFTRMSLTHATASVATKRVATARAVLQRGSNLPASST